MMQLAMRAFQRCLLRGCGWLGQRRRPLLGQPLLVQPLVQPVLAEQALLCLCASRHRHACAQQQVSVRTVRWLIE